MFFKNKSVKSIPSVPFSPGMPFCDPEELLFTCKERVGPWAGRGTTTLTGQHILHALPCHLRAHSAPVHIPPVLHGYSLGVQGSRAPSTLSLPDPPLLLWRQDAVRQEYLAHRRQSPELPTLTGACGSVSSTALGVTLPHSTAEHSLDAGIANC